MTREEVITKVKKLFDLSKSSNESEAALAASKARELLSRYNLCTADLPLDDMRAGLHVREASVQVGKILHSWVKGLLVHVATGFECEHLVKRTPGSVPSLTFIGTGADAQVALMTFQYLYDELNRMVEAALPELRRENRGWNGASLRFAYLDGAVRRIGERFHEEIRPIRDAEGIRCTDLVVAKEHVIDEYMANTFPFIRREYGRARSISAGAFRKGYHDAESLTLRGGQESGAENKALEGAS